MTISKSEKTYTEKELLKPALKVIFDNGNSIKTSDLIDELVEVLKPSGRDLEILFGRNDSRFSQKVRNLISHRTITKYADYDPKEHSLTINENGVHFLKSDLVEEEVIDFVGEDVLENIESSEIDYTNEKVQVDRVNNSVFELKRKYDKSHDKTKAENGLILDESFQRTGLVWRDGQKSKLIESVLLGIPLPVFYFAEDKENNLVVIDGRQRLTALFEFLDGKYSLKGLEFLKHLNGKKITDFTGKMSRFKAVIEDAPLYVNKIRIATPEFLKLQIFARVNKNGTPLNGQEMRHALHQGAITILLGDLSEELIIGVSKNRMKDRYLILRYIAFRLYFLNKLHNYRKNEEVVYTNIDDFLGKSMDAINTFTEDQIEIIKLDFLNTYKRAIEVFSNDAFRKKIGSPINMILFELTLLIVSQTNEKYTNEEISRKFEEYKSIEIEFIDEDNENGELKETMFEQNIKYHRDSKENFLQRISWMRKVLGEENDK